jgi:hypothetical protein
MKTRSKRDSTVNTMNTKVPTTGGKSVLMPNSGNQAEHPKRHLTLLKSEITEPQSSPKLKLDTTSKDSIYKTRYHYQQSHNLKPSLGTNLTRQLHTRGYIVLKGKIHWQHKEIEQFIK